jgi:hypothetical protein
MKLQSSEFPLTRRLFLGHWMAAASLFAQQRPPGTSDSPDEWVCPMDPDVHASKAGKCPRCGMTLVLQVPDRVEYPLEVTSAPDALRPSETATLILRVLDPTTNQAVRRFEIVHEKLMHLFLVSENLEYFLHDHPVPQEDGSFRLNVKLPYGGMYRLLADFYPTGSVPQLAVNTLFVAGQGDAAKLSPALAPSRSANLTAALHLDPEQPLAGLETRLCFTLEPSEGLEKYLGAWGHMLVASEDLIDLIHSHPFLVTGGVIQFNVIFPREGLYRVWTQFQRSGVVNTVVFTIPVKAL